MEVKRVLEVKGTELNGEISLTIVHIEWIYTCRWEYVSIGKIINNCISLSQCMVNNKEFHVSKRTTLYSECYTFIFRLIQEL